ncbi:MAG: surface lipoprotein assembly modifier [Pseudomonadota bacterium]|nr:surface lipoprotein assembly modifier [Pseudomonadota bacterium]
MTTQPGKDLLAAEKYEEAYKVLWQAVKNNPTDTYINILLARAATKLKLYDHAAAAYERILMVKPNHVKARLNLGIAFYRMGSYYLAEKELKELNKPGIQARFRDKAKSYLGRIKQKKSSHQWSGSIAIGRIYDSNVNAAPADDIVDTIDGSYRLRKESTEQSDWGTIANLRITHDWDFGLKGGFSWKNSFVLKNYFYDDESDVNLNMISLASGLVYSEKKSFKLTLPLTFDYLDYGSDPFYRTFGIKPRLDLFHTSWFMTRFYVTLEYQNYNWDKRRDGAYAYVGFMPRVFWSDGRFMLQSRFGYEYKWARKDFRAFQGLKSESLFLMKINRWLRHSIRFEYRNRWYDQRDLRYRNTRDDDRYKIETRFTILMPWQLRTLLSFDYTANDSNVDTYDYRRKRTMIRLEKRF